MKILVVEDSVKLRRSLGFGLASAGHEVDHAENGRQGLSLATDGRYDMILLDLMLPEMDGIELLRRLRAHDRQIQVLVLSALDRVDDRVRGLRAGADDYLVKPFSFNELLARVESLRRGREASLVDETGAANGKAFTEKIEELIEANLVTPYDRFAVYVVEFDETSSIANGWGLRLRRQILSEAIRRLETLVPGAFLARVGTDQLGVIASGLRHRSEVYAIASQLKEVLSRPIRLGGRDLFPSVSVGIVWSSSDCRAADDVMRDAGAALQRSRELGRNRCVLFHDTLREQIVRKFLVENDLRRAIRENELFLEYQPIYYLGTGEISEIEALLRWKHPTRGVIAPAAFMPLLEQSGLIVPVGKWVLSESCRQLGRWRAAGLLESARIAVNLAAKQLVPGIVETVSEALEQAGLEGEALCLEVTETMVVETSPAVVDIFERLKQIGVKISLDDFGTGYSSLLTLLELPFDTLKIDRSFVSPRRGGSNGASSILRSIIALARDFNLEIVAEGVETVEQLRMLRELKCDQVQGFFLSRPRHPDGIPSRSSCKIFATDLSRS